MCGNFIKNTYGSAIQQRQYVMTNTILSHNSAGRFGVYEISKFGVMIVNWKSLFV